MANVPWFVKLSCSECVTSVTVGILPEPLVNSITSLTVWYHYKTAWSEPRLILRQKSRSRTDQGDSVKPAAIAGVPAKLS